MKNSNRKISDFHHKQMDFGFIQSINFFRNINNDGCSEYSLNITLCGNPYYEGNQKLILNFLGVRDIKIGDLNGLFKSLIYITDISEDQMEGINYRVKEDEYQLFSFYCETFEYEII